MTMLLLASVALAVSPSGDLRRRGMLRGSTLILRDANIEVPAPPGENWKWREIPGTDGVPRAYLCVNSSSGDVLAVIPRDYRALHISDAFIANMWMGIEEGTKESHSSLDVREQRRTDLPNVHAVLFHYATSRPDRPRLDHFTYVIPTGEVCLIQASAVTDQVPPFLAAAAAGARPIRDLNLYEVFPVVKSASAMWPYLVTGLCVWAVVSERNRHRRVPRNPWSWVLFSLPVVYALVIMLVRRTGVLADMPPGTGQQLYGYIAGVPMLLGVLLLVPWVFFRARRRKTATAPPSTSARETT